tara:strand:- start:2859 stop:3887 length:1029 start_codon:yes stop_codon:yes gene_type:complete
MKAVSISENSKIIVNDIDEPEIGNEDILIQLEGCGICGTDKENLFGNSCINSTRLGHEICGTIIKKGSKVISKYSEGMRVFVHHHTHCDKCQYCEHGNETMCDKFCDSLIPCGMSEKFILPGWNVLRGCLIPLPDSISVEEGVLIEPLACCIRSWKKINSLKNDSCAIFGMGTIGIMHAMLAKNRQFEKIFCIDLEDEKLEFCKKLELGHVINSRKNDVNLIKQETNDEGVDLIIIATSDMTVFNKAIELVRKGGVIMIFGQPKNNSLCKVDMSKIYAKEISIVTTYAASNKEIEIAISMIKERELKIKKLVTHRFPIDQSEKAFQCAIENNNSVKVMITRI